jgi:hypothetical protein
MRNAEKENSTLSDAEVAVRVHEHSMLLGASAAAREHTAHRGA